MNLSEFLNDKPKKTLEKTSVINDTIKQGKVYVSLITKNGKEFFKVYYLENNNKKVFQMKKTAASVEYLKKYSKMAICSDKALDALL